MDAKTYADVKLGANPKIGEYVILGVIPDKMREPVETVIGDNAVIRSHTVIYAGNQIGDNFQTGHHTLIRENNIIGDDVSIGSGTVVNRGGLGDTTIGSGSKIDSLVIISHNVEVGEDCLFVSQVGISGSVKIGSHVTFGGQVGVAGHLEIGDNVTVAAQSGVSGNLAANGTYFGSPARPMSETRRTIAALHKLPELRKEIRRVQKHMADITAMLARDVKDMRESDPAK